MNYRMIAVLLLFPFLISAQETYDFLRLDLNPRSAALGGSYVSGTEDADVLFHNPAGINFLQNTPVSFSFVKHLMDINLAGVSASRDFEGIGRFGIGIKYINYGTFIEADEYGNRGGEYGAGELAFVLGYGSTLSENFYYGANVKFIYSSIADYSSSALAFDLGLNYAIPSELINIGVAVLNVGTQISSYVDTKENLPLDITIGASKKLEHLPLKVYLDFHRINEKEDTFGERFSKFTLGAEFTLSNALRLRLGFDNQKRKELKIGDFAGLAGFNLGFGLTIKDYVFDYAFTSLGEIGALHRIGVKSVF